jgi:uracil-DNA glycosylase
MSARSGFFGSKPFSRANQLLAGQGAELVDWKLP